MRTPLLTELDILYSLAGDACMRMVAQAIDATAHRPADVAARFGARRQRPAYRDDQC